VERNNFSEDLTDYGKIIINNIDLDKFITKHYIIRKHSFKHN